MWRPATGWRAALPRSADAALVAAGQLHQFGSALAAAGDLSGPAEAYARAEAAYADPLLTAAAIRLADGNLGDARSNRGWVALKSGDAAAAEARFAEAGGPRRELAAAFSGDPYLREKLRSSLVYRTLAARALNRPADARALGVALVQDFRQKPGFRGDVEGAARYARRAVPGTVRPGEVAAGQSAAEISGRPPPARAGPAIAAAAGVREVGEAFVPGACHERLTFEGARPDLQSRRIT